MEVSSGHAQWRAGRRDLQSHRQLHIAIRRNMPRGSKEKYTDKQKRQAEHIEEGYESRGVPESEAERRAWATVNATTHGGKKSGSGRGRTENHEPERKGGHIGGRRQSHADRSRADTKGSPTQRAE